MINLHGKAENTHIHTEISPPVNITARLYSPQPIKVRLDSSGPKGDDYVLTEEDKEEIAKIVEEKFFKPITNEQIYSLFKEDADNG